MKPSSLIISEAIAMKTGAIVAFLCLNLALNAFAQCGQIVFTEEELAFLDASGSCIIGGPRNQTATKAKPQPMHTDPSTSPEDVERAKLARRGFLSLVHRGPTFADCLVTMYLNGGIFSSWTRDKGLREVECRPSGAALRVLRCIAPEKARNALYKNLQVQLQLARTQKPYRDKNGYMNDPPAIVAIWGVLVCFDLMSDLEPDNQRLAQAFNPSISLNSSRISAEVVTLARKKNDPCFLPLLLAIREGKDALRPKDNLSLDSLEDSIHYLQKDASYFEKSYQMALASNDLASQKAFYNLKILKEIGHQDVIDRHISELYPLAISNPQFARGYFEAFHELGHDELIRKAQHNAVNPEVSIDATNTLEWIKNEPERKARLQQTTATENPAYQCP
jgi:hypothetical protein